jgi:hypothetical protein
VESLYRFPRPDQPDSDHCLAPHQRIPGFCAENSPLILGEFGGYISFLVQEGSQGSRLPLPMDQRPRDFFTWQRSPRRLTNGNNFVFPGIDYQLAYWMGREYQLIPALRPAELSVTPAQMIFSDTLLGSTRTAQFVVTNQGDIPVGTETPLENALEGSDRPEFAIAGNECIGTLAPGQNCRVTVAFSPGSTGRKTAAWVVTARPGGRGQAAVEGVGMSRGALSLSPGGTRDFGGVLMGQVSGPVRFQISNSGGSPLGPVSVALTDSPDFGLAVDDCTGLTLAPQQSCPVEVQFQPRLRGARSGTLEVSAPSTASSTVGLAGVGLLPAALAFAPASWQFPPTVVGDVSRPVRLVLTNTGDVTAGSQVQLTVAAGGTDVGEFALEATGCPRELPGGAACELALTFAPRAAGARSAEVVAAAQPGGTARIPVTATGQATAALTLAPSSGSSVNFGDVTVGSSAEQEYLVTNSGDQAASALEVTLVGAGFNLQPPAAGDCKGNETKLSGGSSCTIRVRLAPTSVGTYSATLRVAAGLGGNPLPLALTGNSPAGWALWRMPSSPGEGLPNPASYTLVTLAGDQIILDNVTGLAWQRNVPSTWLTWEQALDYCASLTLGGLDDWRLPSRIELISILDFRATSPSIDDIAFPLSVPATGNFRFWTSSRQARGGPLIVAFAIDFRVGGTLWDTNTTLNPVRCVR